MSKYIPFTTEQKERAASVDLEEFLRRRGEKLITSGRDKRLASDHSITVRGNQWYDHAIEKGGGAIDFVKMFYGKDFPDAVTMLLDGEQGSGLTRGGQHGADAALESGDLLFHGVAGRVSEAGVDALGRHIKQGRDLCGRVEAVGGGLNDGHDAGAAVFRLVAFMQAFCFDFHINYLFTMI